MNTNKEISLIVSRLNEDLLDFSCSRLKDIKPISPDLKDLFFIYNFSVFNSALQIWPYIGNKLITREEYKAFQDVEEYAYRAFSDSSVSKYQLNSFCNATEILSDAKLLREVGGISNVEFTEIFLQVRYKLFRMYSTIKKAYLKKQITEKQISAKTIQNLRARVATLQNEN